MRFVQRKLSRRVRTEVPSYAIVQSIGGITGGTRARRFSERSDFVVRRVTLLQDPAEEAGRRFQDTQARDMSRERPLLPPKTDEQFRPLSRNRSGPGNAPSQRSVRVADVCEVLEVLPPHYQLRIERPHFERLACEDSGRRFSRSADAVRELHQRRLGNAPRRSQRERHGTPSIPSESLP